MNSHLTSMFQDFILSRKAMLRSPKTISNYEYSAGGFVTWCGDAMPTGALVRAYLADVAGRGCNDSTVHTHARGIRAFLSFCQAEWNMEAIRVPMPRIAEKRLPLLDPPELKQVVGACHNARDKALVLVMADTGLRRTETASLTWDSVNVSTGSIVVTGKGRKQRVVFMGIQARRSLLKWQAVCNTESVFGLTSHGVRSALRRIGTRADVHLTAHMLRRTFATLSLRAGMNPIHLQALMGHSSLEQTRQYIRLADVDLQDAVTQSSPVDRFL